MRVNEELTATAIFKKIIMEYEFRDRDFEMWLEGTSENEPNELEIIEHAKQKGFELNYIEIWFDNFQSIWRFNADLIRIKF